MQLESIALAKAWTGPEFKPVKFCRERRKERCDVTDDLFRRFSTKQQAFMELEALCQQNLVDCQRLAGGSGPGVIAKGFRAGLKIQSLSLPVLTLSANLSLTDH